MAKNLKVEPLIVKNALHCFMLEEDWEVVSNKIYSFVK
jgi:hypothetical protein